MSESNKVQSVLRVLCVYSLCYITLVVETKNVSGKAFFLFKGATMPDVLINVNTATMSLRAALIEIHSGDSLYRILSVLLEQDTQNYGCGVIAVFVSQLQKFKCFVPGSPNLPLVLCVLPYVTPYYLCYVTRCGLTSGHQRFGETYYFNIQCRGNCVDWRFEV